MNKSSELHVHDQIATHISLDAGKLNRAVMTVITNRLNGISRKGRKLTPSERSRYGKSAMLRYLADEPIYPIGYVRHKIPMNKNGKAQVETVDELKLKLLRQSLHGRSIEYVEDQIHCHHKIPKSQGGTDEYQNLILVTATIHKLIHATNADTIQQYLQACKPNFKKLNVLRQLVGNTILSVD